MIQRFFFTQIHFCNMYFVPFSLTNYYLTSFFPNYTTSQFNVAKRIKSIFSDLLFINNILIKCYKKHSFNYINKFLFSMVYIITTVKPVSIASTLLVKKAHSLFCVKSLKIVLRGPRMYYNLDNLTSFAIPHMTNSREILRHSFVRHNFIKFRAIGVLLEPELYDSFYMNYFAFALLTTTLKHRAYLAARSFKGYCNFINY